MDFNKDSKDNGSEQQPEMTTPEHLQKADISEQDEYISVLSKRGYDYLKYKNIKEAKESFSFILELDPNNCYALVGMGDAFRQERNFKKSLEYYQKCLETEQQNSFALFGIADAYKAMNNLSKAVFYWEKYLQQDDTNVNVLTRAADAYRKIKQFEPSKKLYERVLVLEPGNDYALIGLGHLYFDFGEYNLALLYWERMYRKSPHKVDIRILTSLGNCHRKLKTFKNGLEYFQKALELQPKNFFALFGMADCYRGIKDYRNSLYYWLEILKVDPKNKVIITRAADAHRVLGSYDEAEKLYEKALNIDFDLYAHIGMALIDKEKGKFQEAIKRFNFLIEKFPKNPRIYSETSKCYEELGDKEKALSILKSFRKIDANNKFINMQIEKLS